MFTSYRHHGFLGFSFKDIYDNQCSIQESSLADDNCIWFGPDDANPKVLASRAASVGVETKETTGWVPYPIPVEILLYTRMHLSQEQVRELIPVLQHFVDHGYLPEEGA